MRREELKPFFATLRELGFHRDDYSRSKLNGWYYDYMAKFPDEMTKVNVQFFVDPDGNVSGMRVANMHNYPYDGRPHPYGIGDNVPSDFTTIKGMLEAVEFEKTRYNRGVPKEETRTFE